MKLLRNTEIKNTLYILAGLFFANLAFNVFLIPNNIAAGGFTGIGQLVNSATGLPVGTVSLALNVKYIAGVERGLSIIDEYETISPLERAAEYVMLAMRTSAGISEYDYRTRCQCDWKPVEKLLKAFEYKGWAEKTGDRWHFTVSGFLISNTLINIMLEMQASGRNAGVPDFKKAEDLVHRIVLTKSEEELFSEQYE